MTTSPLTPPPYATTPSYTDFDGALPFFQFLEPSVYPRPVEGQPPDDGYYYGVVPINETVTVYFLNPNNLNIYPFGIEANTMIEYSNRGILGFCKFDYTVASFMYAMDEDPDPADTPYSSYEMTRYAMRGFLDLACQTMHSYNTYYGSIGYTYQMTETITSFTTFPTESYVRRPGCSTASSDLAESIVYHGPKNSPAIIDQGYRYYTRTDKSGTVCHLESVIGTRYEADYVGASDYDMLDTVYFRGEVKYHDQYSAIRTVDNYDALKMFVTRVAPISVYYRLPDSWTYTTISINASTTEAYNTVVTVYSTVDDGETTVTSTKTVNIMPFESVYNPSGTSNTIDATKIVNTPIPTEVNNVQKSAATVRKHTNLKITSVLALMLTFAFFIQ